MEKEGVLIFYNGIYGFIRADEDRSKTIYFSKDSIEDGVHLELFDKLLYLESPVIRGKHEGKTRGINIRRIGKEEITDKRYFGIVTKKRKGKFQFISSPHLDSLISFTSGRKLNHTKDLKEGDEVIFKPVKSLKNDRIIAEFVIPIQDEKDESFKNFTKNQIFQYSSVGFDLISFLESEEIIDTVEKYLLLKQEFSRFSKTEKESITESLFSDTFKIQAFEDEIIREINLKLLYSYFLDTSSYKKYHIFEISNDNIKDNLMQNYFSYIVEQRRFLTNNTQLITLLNLLNQKKERYYKYRKEITDKIYAESSFDRICQLIKSKKIIYKKEFIESLNIEDEKSVDFFMQYNSSKVLQTFLDYWKLNDTKYSFLFWFLNKVKTVNNFPDLINSINNNETIALLLYLKGYKESIPDEIFDKVYFFNIPLSFKIDYTLNQTESAVIDLIEFFDFDIQSIVFDYKSNKDIYEYSLITHYKRVYQLCELSNGALIYSKFVDSTCDDWSVQDRCLLWTYSLISDGFYDYYDFRNAFSNLSKFEKSIFKEKAESLNRNNINSIHSDARVRPLFDTNEEFQSFKGIKVISINELLFRENYILLKVCNSNDSFFKQQWIFSTSYINLLKHDEEFQSLQFRVVVNELKNIEILKSDLEVLRIKFNIYKIETTLSSVLKKKQDLLKDNTFYNVDHILNKKSNEYLLKLHNENYIKNNDLIPIHPELIVFKKASKIIYNTFNHHFLYSVESNGGFAIIWEDYLTSDDMATYIFRSNRKEYLEKLLLIKETITSNFKNIRSALVFSNSQFHDLRVNLGFQVCLKKRRGDLEAFEKWVYKLHNALDDEFIIKDFRQNKRVGFSKVAINDLEVDILEKSQIVSQKNYNGEVLNKILLELQSLTTELNYLNI